MQYTRPRKGHSVLILFLFALLVLQSAGAKESPPSVATPLQALPIIEDVDLLSINQELKDLVDREIRPISSKEKQTKALHSLLFTSKGRNIQYAFTDTKTAQETFDSKSGDCLSQAALYVAAARYVGLPAVFQSIRVPPNWEKGYNFYFVPGHVNVYIRLPRRKLAIVEFVKAYIGATQEKAVRISDDVVVAQYYNNKGAEALDQQNHALAIAYFKKSIAQTDRLDTPWSNLGVAYKLFGDLESAERAYLRALRLKSRNLSTITNIYQLYIATGEDKKAEKYFKKVERYSKKNPYKLFQLAEINIFNKELSKAERILRKTIRIKPDEPAFRKKLAEIYYELNQPEKAVRQLKEVEKLLLSETEQEK